MRSPDLRIIDCLLFPSLPVLFCLLQAYGAGLLSSFGELEHACAKERADGSPPPEYRPWDPFSACKQKYPITTYQPIYYVAESLVRYIVYIVATCDITLMSCCMAHSERCQAPNARVL